MIELSNIWNLAASMNNCRSPWDSEVYIIAELSSNHAKDKNIALKSIEAAAKAGVSAVKTQLFTAETLGIPSRDKSPVIDDPHSPWANQTLYDLYEDAALPYSWYPDLIKCAEFNNVDLFASVFDDSSIDAAIRFEFKVFKVSSFELIHTPLLKIISLCGYPTILSTGMASLKEIESAYSIFSQANVSTCFLQCTSDYPASLTDTHVYQMKLLGEHLQTSVGLSDHSLSNLPAIASVALGARVVEKHFILDKSITTPDSFFSLTAEEFCSLVQSIRDTEQIISQKNLPDGVIDVEKHSYWERPSLYASRDLPANTQLGPNDIIIRRPSLGIPANKYDSVLGKYLRTDLKMYSPLKAHDLR